MVAPLVKPCTDVHDHAEQTTMSSLSIAEMHEIAAAGQTGGRHATCNFARLASNRDQ